MVTPKPPTGSYSAALRARRLARSRFPVSGTEVMPEVALPEGYEPSSAAVMSPAPVDRVRIGRWVIVDEGGDLVVVNGTTGARVVLVTEGEVD